MSRSSTATLMQRPPPPRLHLPTWWSALLYAVVVGMFGFAWSHTEFQAGDLVTYFPNMLEMAGDMVPPATDGLGRMAASMWVTIEIAIVGVGLGIAISLPLAMLACWEHSPHPALYAAARGLITFCRTVPDLVWALFFIAWVGLGPPAGILAIVMDTIGYCGRFFADDMEEVDRGPAEALTAIGAGRTGVLVCATLPGARPAMINDGLYAFEKGVRSSMILGLVGAGGIGVELEAAWSMFRYAQATTIILMIFVVVLVVEQASTAIRRKLLHVHR